MRDQLMAELNKLADRAAEIRNDDDNVDALIEVTARINGVRAEIAALDAREVPAAPALNSAPAAPRSFGEAAVATGFAQRGVVDGPLMTVNRDVFSGPAAGGLDVVVPDFTPGIDAQPRVDVTVIDLIPTVPTSSEVVTFYVQTGFVNASGAIPRRVSANGGTTYGAYELSSVTVEKKTVPVVKIGHAFPTDDDTLADSPALAALLNRDGIDGLRRELESQLLAPADTPNGLSSLIVTGTGRAQVEAYEGGSGQDLIEAIRRAKTKAELAAIPARFVLLTPEAREKVELAKDEDNRYLGAGPFAGLNGSLWQLPMVTSYFLPAGVEAVVGSFEKVRLRVRRGIEVQTTNSHADDFLKDAVKIKVSGRYALENTRPEAMVVVGPAEGDDEE
jgi:HK97 family phage major capsid protein